VFILADCRLWSNKQNSIAFAIVLVLLSMLALRKIAKGGAGDSVMSHCSQRELMQRDDWLATSPVPNIAGTHCAWRYCGLQTRVENDVRDQIAKPSYMEKLEQEWAERALAEQAAAEAAKAAAEEAAKQVPKTIETGLPGWLDDARCLTLCFLCCSEITTTISTPTSETGGITTRTKRQRARVAARERSSDATT
jgi:hypothetical protein